MQPLQAHTYSLRPVSSAHYLAYWRSIELSAQDSGDLMASRQHERMLRARTVPADPFTAWLDQRDEDRRPSAVA